MTKHNATCTRAFARYDRNCPRCQELLTGATPRPGWSTHNDTPPPREARKANHKHQLNPGGYCNICNEGRDFS